MEALNDQCCIFCFLPEHFLKGFFPQSSFQIVHSGNILCIGFRITVTKEFKEIIMVLHYSFLEDLLRMEISSHLLVLVLKCNYSKYFIIVLIEERNLREEVE